MGRKREAMSEGKKNIIGMLLEEYEIKTASCSMLILSDFSSVGF